MARTTSDGVGGSFRSGERHSQEQKSTAIGTGTGAARPKHRRNWKSLRATSIPHAMELCLTYARETANLSVERVADRMGQPSHWVLYKWMQEGSIPARMIRPFELACGCEYVTRYVAASAHKLLIDLPTGRHAEPGDIQKVQEACTAAVGALIAFYAGRADATDTHTALTVALESLAAERCEVERYAAPELALEPTHD